jgi:hypothetical protein
VGAGHGRVLACGELGWSEVPTLCLDHLTPAQARAFRIADNRLTEISEWDDRLLSRGSPGRSYLSCWRSPARDAWRLMTARVGFPSLIQGRLSAAFLHFRSLAHRLLRTRKLLFPLPRSKQQPWVPPRPSQNLSRNHQQRCVGIPGVTTVKGLPFPISPRGGHNVGRCHRA